MLRIHGCTRIFVHISKLSWFYLGLLNYWKRKNILIISCNGMARSYHHTLYFIYFLKFLQVWWWIIIIFLGGGMKMTSGWVWLMSDDLLTPLLFPHPSIFSFWWLTRLLCRTDHTTFLSSTPHHSLLPFFFILARKEGMLTQREEKKTYIYLGGTCLFLEKREVWKNPHVGLSDKPQFFFPLTRMRDWGECPIELIKYLSLHDTFNCF